MYLLGFELYRAFLGIFFWEQAATGYSLKGYPHFPCDESLSESNVGNRVEEALYQKREEKAQAQDPFYLEDHPRPCFSG